MTQLTADDPVRDHLRPVLSLGEAVDELLAAPPKVHLGGAESWALEREVLGWLADSLKPEWRTIETGCGSSSIVFMLAGTEHTIVAPNASEHDSTRQWCAERGFSTARTTSIVEDSTKALPSLGGEFDLGLIDGGHAFPLPFVDCLYIAERLRVGGLLIVDDINLPTCGILHAFLDADHEHWERVRLFDRTSVFRKTDDVVVSPHDWTGQPWVLAQIARRQPLARRVGRLLRHPARLGDVLARARARTAGYSRCSLMSMRARIAITRVSMRGLQLLGLRDRIIRWRHDRTRARRVAAEAHGDDRLSKPALHEIDVKLDAIIDRDRGFFVEAGAHDGFTQSNTYWLERFRNWRGLLIEPMPELAAEARRSRPAATVVQCALVAADDPRRRLPMQFGGLMSVVEGVKEPNWPSLGTASGWKDPYGLTVEARTLSSLLDQIEAPDVDLLSLDVEGFESAALRGLDLDRHAPRYVLVEIHDRDRDLPPVEEILAPRYLQQAWLSPLDLLYVRRDVA